MWNIFSFFIRILRESMSTSSPSVKERIAALTSKWNQSDASSTSKQESLTISTKPEVGMNGWMDGWIDRRVNDWMNGWMDGWTNGMEEQIILVSQYPCIYASMSSCSSCSSFFLNFNLHQFNNLLTQSLHLWQRHGSRSLGEESPPLSHDSELGTISTKPEVRNIFPSLFFFFFHSKRRILE